MLKFKKRRYHNISAIALLYLTLFIPVACKNPISPQIDADNPTEKVTPGWYLYTTNADSDSPQQTYFYINTSGKIEKAGSSLREYADAELKMLQKQFSYSICNKNADGVSVTFSSCDSPPGAR